MLHGILLSLFGFIKLSYFLVVSMLYETIICSVTCTMTSHTSKDASQACVPALRSHSRGSLARQSSVVTAVVDMNTGVMMISRSQH